MHCVCIMKQCPGGCASLVRLDDHNRLIHRLYRFCFWSRLPLRPSPPALPLDLPLRPTLERAAPRGSRALGCFDFPKSAQDAAYTKCKKIHEQQSMNRASSLVRSADAREEGEAGQLGCGAGVLGEDREG